MRRRVDAAPRRRGGAATWRRGVVATTAPFTGTGVEPKGEWQGRRIYTKPWPADIDEWTHFMYDATGNGTYYGTVISKQGVGEFSPSAGTPHHYWDESLKTQFPPNDWELPRVAVTRWETDI